MSINEAFQEFFALLHSDETTDFEENQVDPSHSDYPIYVIGVARRRIIALESDVSWLRDKIIANNVESREVSEILLTYGKSLGAKISTDEVDMLHPNTVAKPVINHLNHVVKELTERSRLKDDADRMVNALKDKLKIAENTEAQLRETILKMRKALGSFMKKVEAASPRASPRSKSDFAVSIEEEEDIEAVLEFANRTLEETLREADALRAQSDEAIGSLKVLHGSFRHMTSRQRKVAEGGNFDDLNLEGVDTIGDLNTTVSVVAETITDVVQRGLNEADILRKKLNRCEEELAVLRLTSPHAGCARQIFHLKDRIESLCQIIQRYERDLRPTTCDVGLQCYIHHETPKVTTIPTTHTSVPNHSQSPPRTASPSPSPGRTNHVSPRSVVTTSAGRQTAYMYRKVPMTWRQRETVLCDPVESTPPPGAYTPATNMTSHPTRLAQRKKI